MTAPGERTRAKLLNVATRLFGERGFEAVSTRDIASAAGATLPSIAHHFGSKEGLYRAVLAAIADAMAKRFAPAAAEAAAFLAGPKATREATLEALQALLDAQARVVLTNRPDWTALIIQRQQQPLALVGDLARPFDSHVLEPAVRLIGRLRNQPPDNERVKLEALALVGWIMMFRVARASSLGFMGWPDFTDAAVQAILATQRAQVRLLFER